MRLEDFLATDVSESDSDHDDEVQTKNVKESRKGKPTETNVVATSADVEVKR